MKKILNVLAFTFIGLTALAQGQPSAKVFSNFNYNLSDKDNNFKAFEVNRAYLGYSYALSDEFTTKITFDVGNNSFAQAYTTEPNAIRTSIIVISIRFNIHIRK